MSAAVQTLLTAITLISIIAAGYFIWKTKAADVQGQAITVWRSIADGYQEKLELRDQQIADMRATYAGVEAELRAQIDGLRRQVDELKKHDQAAVLAAITQHELDAAHRGGASLDRHQETLGVLTEIRDTLKQGGIS